MYIFGKNKSKMHKLETKYNLSLLFKLTNSGEFLIFSK